MSEDSAGEVDRLLRQAAVVADRAAAGPELDVEVLLALRGGRLPEDEARVVEQRLRDDAGERAVLVAVGEGASDTLRDAVVAAWPVASPAPVRWPALVAAAAALLLGVGLWQLWPAAAPEHPPLPTYAVEGPLGGVKFVRDDSTAPSAVFLPVSEVQIVLRPAGEVPAAPRLGVFVSGEDGRLRRRSAAVESRPGGVLVVTATGEALFGEAPGRYRLHLVLAHEAAALDALAGRAEDDARRTRDLWWHPTDVEYQADPALEGGP